LKRKPKTVNDMEFAEYSDFIEEKWANFKNIILTEAYLSCNIRLQEKL